MGVNCRCKVKIPFKSFYLFILFKQPLFFMIKVHHEGLIFMYTVCEQNNIFNYLFCLPTKNYMYMTEIRERLHATLTPGSEGWRSGESTRLLPMWPGFNSLTLHHMCPLTLLLVLVLAPRVFLLVLQFSSLHQSQHFQVPI